MFENRPITENIFYAWVIYQNFYVLINIIIHKYSLSVFLIISVALVLFNLYYDYFFYGQGWGGGVIG